MAGDERRVRRYLDELVAEGELGPGDRLPAERALVEQLNLPRSAVRRALAALEQEGGITRGVGRGTFLARPLRRGGEPPSDTSPVELMQARMVVEPSIAATAARSATQADLRRIADLLDQEARSRTFGSRETADARIHRAIAAATHNDLLVAVYDVLDAARELPVWGSLKRRTWSLRRAAGYHRAHLEVVAALREREPRAAQAAMVRHLHDLSADLLGDHDADGP